MDRIKTGILIFFTGVLLFSVMPAEKAFAEDGGAIFFNAGVGIANNLRMVDRLNGRYQGLEEEELTGEEGNPLFYKGIDLEGRFFLGNIVYALSYGYYDVSMGKRRGNAIYTNPVTPDETTVHYNIRLSLKIHGFRASAYYKVSLDDDNFILLGGGLGYYIGIMEEELDYSYEADIISGTDEQRTIGWHTGLEYNIKYGPVAISLGFMSRFVEFINFEPNKEYDEKNAEEDGNEEYDDSKISAGLTGLYLYVGAGYMF